MRIQRINESAYEVVLDEPAYRWITPLSAARIEGLREAVPAYHSLGLYVNPDRFNLATFEAWLNEQPSPSETPGRLIEVPCRYDGEDLEAVAEALGFTTDQIIEKHSSRHYRCYAIGFCPGFPYLGYLDRELVLPRKDQPRPKIEPGSVAIAGNQTGIYPLERPGGWWLIGRTDMRLVDLESKYFAIEPGDTVRFVPA